MKRDYIKGVVAATAIVTLLTGCGSSMPYMTSEQEWMIGEYAALTLLRYDANNRSRLVPYEQVEERKQKLLAIKEREELKEMLQQQTENANPTEDTPEIIAGEDTVSNTVGTIGAFFGLPEGVTVSYTGSEVCDSYPEDGSESDYFTLDAAAGKKLLVLKFNISNQSQEEQLVDILSQSTAIQIKVNGSVTRSALVTMLMNDLSTYRATVAVGESVETVLLTELDEDTAANLSAVTLQLSNGTNTYAVQLQ